MLVDGLIGKLLMAAEVSAREGKPVKLPVEG
jgi:hypothetical protein